MDINSIILELFEMGAINFGQFTLKNGISSPIYIDLRLSISRPKLLVDIAESLYKLVQDRPFDLVCGVPYTALPFATVISVQHNIPLILKRKEKKDYGTKKLIEGLFSSGQRCLIIEDVVNSGKSIVETIDPLREVGIEVTDAVVLVDREQGGKQFLAQRGIELHSFCTISFIIHCLTKEKKIDATIARDTLAFIHSHQTHG